LGIGRVLLGMACLGWLPVIRGSMIRLFALRRAYRQRQPGSAAVTASPSTSFSLIVAARQEAAVLPATLAALTRTDHPHFEILVVVEAGDAPTVLAAQAAALEAPDRIRVLVRAGGPGRKPAALNYALAHCRYDVVGVFDADGIVQPGLLRAVDECFSVTGVDAVQAGNQPFTGRPRWYELHNMLEFYLMFLNESAPVPDRLIRLSGNSVFVRTALLRALGGWRETALAEDCDLGIRLTARGARLAFLYRPELATMEETPISLTAFVRQRTRWNQGFLQVLQDGGWRSLPTGALRRAAADLLLTNLARALLGVGLPMLVLAAAVTGSPLVWAPAIAAFPGALNAVLTSGLLRSFAREFPIPVRLHQHLQVLLGWPAYQLLLVVPAIRAVIRQLAGRDDWEKSAHLGVVAPVRS
jgi:cellulose synthase/poly-beta-1,6-N-acetylglucosamine synthase-like glycosyltransferase